jgi:flagellar export protein FliJ
MAFRFPLESVLRLRENLERQQELLLYQANQRVFALTRQIEELDAGMTENARYQSARLQSGVSAAELQFDLLCHAVLLEWRHDLETKLAEAQSQRDAQAENLRQARRQREVIETLRHHQLQAYRAREARQDQRRADDLFLLRRSFLQRS